MNSYLELIKLLKEDASDKFDISINKGTKYDILHAHTVEPRNYFKMKKKKFLIDFINYIFTH